MAITFKRTTPEDEDFEKLIEELNRELWERNQGRQQEYVSFNLLESGTACLLAFYHSTPVACGAFRILENSTAEIKRMFVRPGYRGKGISKLVLEELELWSIEKGCFSAVLETGKSHPEAISLYTKSGYKPIENYGPYENFPESLCFGKTLTG